MDITTVDCSLVQEGDDNVDINCQTIDGKIDGIRKRDSHESYHQIPREL